MTAPVRPTVAGAWVLVAGLWRTERRGLRSPHKPELCLELLGARVGPGWFKARTTHPAVGRVRGDRFRIRKRLEASQNAFQTLVRGQVAADRRGSRISLELGVSPIVRTFTLAWLALATLMACTAVLYAGVVRPPHAWIFVTAVGFPLYGLALVALGRWFARDEGEYLVCYLVELWQAQEVPLEAAS